MKRFLLYIAAFLTIVASVDALFGMVMKGLLTETKKGDWGRNNYIFNDVNADAIILGSSRAIHHYDPVIFSDSLGMTCYNCGEDGMGILLMYVRYQAIRERHIPQVVIYEVLPEYDLLTERDNQKYLKFLRPYSDMPSIDSVIENISSEEQLKLFSRMYRYNSIFVDIVSQRISKSPETAATYTYSPLEEQMNYEPPSNSNRSHIPCDSLKLAYMERLIVRCQKDGTNLVFTASPSYKVPSDADFSPLKELCKKYNVPFVNHFCDTDYCNNPALFADASHLNNIGAEIVSKAMASEIKSVIGQ